MSPTPGIITTHKGNPTVTRYVGATLFVVHYSELSHVRLMSKLDTEATVESKLVFERIFDSYGVRVLHYHANNCLFDTNIFKESCNTAKHTLSLCGVNAHHQNGTCEIRINYVTAGAWADLLHAYHRWPNAIHAYVWGVMLMLIGQGRGKIYSEITRSHHIPGLDTSSCLPVVQFVGRPRCNL